MSAIRMHKSARVEVPGVRPNVYYAPLCGRSPRAALMVLHWKRVTCKRCLRDRPNTQPVSEAVPLRRGL